MRSIRNKGIWENSLNCSLPKGGEVRRGFD